MRRLLIALAGGAALALLGRLLVGRGLDDWSGARMRFLVAALGLGWVVFVRSRRRGGRPLRTATAHGVLGAVALAAWASWFDFGVVPDIGGVHRHDVFHYYIGAKYHRELGYGLLYRCAALAEAEDGREAEVRQRKIRDLVTLRWIPAEQALDDPAACRSRFSSERWSAFRQDVHNLRVGMVDAGWKAAQTDHGYNPTPAWTASSGLLARLVPSSDAGLRLLASLDILLIGASMLALHAAFGFRVAAVALILWGTQETAKLSWIGFSMLRVDWLFAIIASLSLLRRGRPALAGAALGWAAATRVFPALGLVGVLLVGFASPALRRRFAGARLRFTAGFLAAIAVMVALGAAVAGPSSWPEWAAHIRRHVSGSVSNQVGLGVVVAFDREHRVEAIQARMPSAPPEEWKSLLSEEIVQTHKARWLPLLALRLGFAALLILSLARLRRPWLGLPLALLAAPAMIDMTNYYLMFFIAAAVLVAARSSIERFLLGFAAGVQLLMVMPAVARFVDDRHLALSLAYLGAAVALQAAVGIFRPR